MKDQAKFLGPVHITYQICEQRMIWRGWTLAQSRQSIRWFNYKEGGDEGSCQIL